jgi:hypothetical protein
MRNKKAPKSMLDLHLDVEGDTHVKVSLTRTPESTSFRLATAESGHQSLPADLKHVDDIPADEPERRMSKLEIVTLTKVSKDRYHKLLKSGGLGTVHEEHRAATGTPRKVVDFGAVCKACDLLGFEVPTWEAVEAYRAGDGGGEVAPRALAPSSTLRLELIVETP